MGYNSAEQFKKNEQAPFVDNALKLPLVKDIEVLKVFETDGPPFIAPDGLELVIVAVGAARIVTGNTDAQGTSCPANICAP
jgi:hypothetical protein